MGAKKKSGRTKAGTSGKTAKKKASSSGKGSGKSRGRPKGRPGGRAPKAGQKAKAKKAGGSADSSQLLQAAGIEQVSPSRPDQGTRKVHYIIEKVPGDKCFVVVDGTRISNLKELAEVLEGMEEETFIFHSNKDKNDFSNWIKEVVGEIKLAENIRNKTRKETHTEVLKHIVRKIT